MTEENDRDIAEEAKVLFDSYQRGNRSVDMSTKAFLLLHDLSDEVKRLRNEVKDLRSACEFYLDREQQVINLLGCK